MIHILMVLEVDSDDPKEAAEAAGIFVENEWESCRLKRVGDQVYTLTEAMSG